MWSEKEARQRLRRSYDEAKDLALKPLTREMDLENLSPVECRIVTGVHLYLDVVNFQTHLDEAQADKEKLRKLLRHLHVYQRVITTLLYETDGAEKIHFQGARLHAVIFKPYDTSDVKDPASKRLGAARLFASQAKDLAKLLAHETGISFSLEAGIEMGDTIATRNGQAGSRELLFIGEAANVAAKRLTGIPGTRYGPVAQPFVADLPAVDPLGDGWSAVVENECSKYPISHFDLYEPSAGIDYDRLGARTAMLDAASFFGDLTGFTALVAGATTMNAKRDLLRCLHAVRSEMRQVVNAEYQGDHVQYQGDRIQGLFYEAATSGRYPSKSFEAAAAMQSVMKVCTEMFPTLAGVGMTVGIDHGRVLVSQLGMRGNRDIVALGASVIAASNLQDASSSGQIRISGSVLALLEAPLASLFKEEGSAYVSTADAEVVGAKQESSAYNGKVVVAGSASTGARVVSSESGVRPARSWGVSEE